MTPLARRTLLASIDTLPADASPASAGDADWIPLREVMTPLPVCVRPDMEVRPLMGLFVTFDVSVLPVVDDVGRPLGVVSRSDLLLHCYRGDEDATVAQLMTRAAVTLPDTATLSRAAAVIVHEAVHQLVIVSFTGEVVGVVCALDIVRWLIRHRGAQAGATSAVSRVASCSISPE